MSRKRKKRVEPAPELCAAVEVALRAGGFDAAADLLARLPPDAYECPICEGAGCWACCQSGGFRVLEGGTVMAYETPVGLAQARRLT